MFNYLFSISDSLQTIGSELAYLKLSLAIVIDLPEASSFLTITSPRPTRTIPPNHARLRRAGVNFLEKLQYDSFSLLWKSLFEARFL